MHIIFRRQYELGGNRCQKRGMEVESRAVFHANVPWSVLFRLFYCPRLRTSPTVEVKALIVSPFHKATSQPLLFNLVQSFSLSPVSQYFLSFKGGKVCVTEYQPDVSMSLIVEACCTVVGFASHFLCCTCLTSRLTVLHRFTLSPAESILQFLGYTAVRGFTTT